MKVFAISDLHLPAGDNKPMDIFGSHWENHFERISDNWKERVTGEDIVLLSGDLSWAMRLEQAKQDLESIGALPGRKVIIRGNHDYWWSSVSRLRVVLPDGMYAIQNDAVKIDGITFCGTRGWILPGESADPDDERIYEREKNRLKMSLDCAEKLANGGKIICMLHYPPLTGAVKETGFTSVIEQSRADTVVYGHLHGAALHGAFTGTHNGVDYYMTSCDGTDFKLVEIK